MWIIRSRWTLGSRTSTESLGKPIFLSFSQPHIKHTNLRVPTSRAVVNNFTYLGQPVPSLYSALSLSSNYSSNPKVYGQVNPFVLKHNEVVEIIVNNNHNNLHPWHLHGHDFQVVQRSNPGAGPFTGYGTLAPVPLKRDTIMANKNGHLVIRFVADNPDKSSLLPSNPYSLYTFISRSKLTPSHASGSSIATLNGTLNPASSPP